MSNTIKHLINQFNLQTRLYNNVTAEISDSIASKPMNENTNHIAWLTGHIVSTRYMLATVLGIQDKEPFSTLFKNGKGIDRSANYPSMKELTNGWSSISEKVLVALNSLSEEVIASKAPRAVPTGESIGDFISFIMHHEAYTLGQLGIYRRFYGIEAMKYN